MREPRFLVVGHSHTVCIVEALRSAEPERRHGSARLPYVSRKPPAERISRFVRKKAAMALLRLRGRRGSDRFALPPIVGGAAADIRDQVATALGRMLEPPRRVRASEIPALLEEAGITVLASVLGHAHNAFALVELEKPLDFVLPEREDLGADLNKQLVPYDVVRDVLYERMQRPLRELAFLQELVGERMLVIETPPPIGDDAHILECSEPLYKSFGTDWQLATPILRYKFWRLSSGIYSAFCREKGLAFVPAPAAAMDDGMFLKKEGWPPNPTHANAWYGARVIEEVKALLAAAEGGWMAGSARP